MNQYSKEHESCSEHTEVCCTTMSVFEQVVTNADGTKHIYAISLVLNDTSSSSPGRPMTFYGASRRAATPMRTSAGSRGSLIPLTLFGCFVFVSLGRCTFRVHVLCMYLCHIPCVCVAILLVCRWFTQCALFCSRRICLNAMIFQDLLIQLIGKGRPLYAEIV